MGFNGPEEQPQAIVKVQAGQGSRSGVKGWTHTWKLMGVFGRLTAVFRASFRNTGADQSSRSVQMSYRIRLYTTTACACGDMIMMPRARASGGSGGLAGLVPV